MSERGQSDDGGTKTLYVIDGYAPLAVQFTGSESFDPDLDPLSYFWDFGDGGTSALANPTHVYTTAGVYQVMLTVSDGAGASDQAFLQIAVDNTYPVAVINSPANGQAFDIGETRRRCFRSGSISWRAPCSFARCL